MRVSVWIIDPQCLIILALSLWYGLTYRAVRAAQSHNHLHDVDQPIPTPLVLLIQLPSRLRRNCFFICGIGLWLLLVTPFVRTASAEWFFVRAICFMLFFFIIPCALAAGLPLTLYRSQLLSRKYSQPQTPKKKAALTFLSLQMLFHPLTGALLLLITPWIVYKTPLYGYMLYNQWVNSLVDVLLIIIGFIYFTGRLQDDVLPRRYPMAISLIVTGIEFIGDGILGLILWQGALLYPEYYGSLVRLGHLSVRMDQTIGAGILSIGGDVLGLPYLKMLFDRFHREQQIRAEAIDAELDAIEAAIIPVRYRHDQRSGHNNF